MKKITNRPSGLQPLIQQRWSPRAFSSQAVAPEVLERLLEAARWAPSCYNEQPWRFVVAHASDAAAFAGILSTLVPFNQGWAKSAAVLGIAVANLNFASGKPNGWAHYDTGQAMAQLAIQAEHEGLKVHQMGGFDPAACQEALAIPEGHVAAAAFAIGYEGDPATLDPQLQGQETGQGERKPLAEIVFHGKFGK
ncbi:MAG: nitroreductase family protein [Bryobacteraceae bacterium]|nr:nitroreductase family protein [Bryobacteraceae bacterium]